MQFTPWDNPMGTDGFEFVEYAAPDPAALGQLFETMGFSAIAKHRTKKVTLYGRVGSTSSSTPSPTPLRSGLRASTAPACVPWPSA